MSWTRNEIDKWLSDMGTAVGTLQRRRRPFRIQHVIPDENVENVVKALDTLVEFIQKLVKPETPVWKNSLT